MSREREFAIKLYKLLRLESELDSEGLKEEYYNDIAKVLEEHKDGGVKEAIE